MVSLGFSTLEIRRYLKKWALWWGKTSSEVWQIEQLLSWFIASCWELSPAAVALGLLQKTYSNDQDLMWGWWPKFCDEVI